MMDWVALAVAIRSSLSMGQVALSTQLLNSSLFSDDFSYSTTINAINSTDTICNFTSISIQRNKEQSNSNSNPYWRWFNWSVSILSYFSLSLPSLQDVLLIKKE